MNSKTIRIATLAIMAIAATVSYTTQRDLLLHWQVETLGAWLLPITVDLLAIICTVAIHSDRVTAEGRKVAMRVLIAAGTMSMTANFLAGETWGSRFAHLWSVVAYLAAEWVATKCTAADPQKALRSERAKRGAATRKANAAKPKRRTRKPVSAPVSPGPLVTPTADEDAAFDELAKRAYL